MLSKRPINILEAEPSPSQTLTSLSFRVHIDPATGLLSTSQAGLQAQALDYESQGQCVKAAKCMLRFLLLAQRLEAEPEGEWKRIGTEALTVIEGHATGYLKNEKTKGAGRLIKALEKWLEQGGRTRDRRWHQIRVLHL